jgi:hypothetical protein
MNIGAIPRLIGMRDIHVETIGRWVIGAAVR